MQGAAIVLRTLVPNARRIFQILAKQQMQDPENGVKCLHLISSCILPRPWIAAAHVMSLLVACVTAAHANAEHSK